MYAYEDGGAIYNQRALPTISNCLFAGNGRDTMTAGGAIYNDDDNGTKIINCTFYGNKVSPVSAGDPSGGGAIYNDDSSWYVVTITNCVFWGNSAWAKPDIRSYKLDEYYGYWEPPIYSIDQIHYTYIDMQQTGAPFDAQKTWEEDLGEALHIIRQDPLFVNVAGIDPYAWNLHLQPGSPCIDAGNDSAVPSGVTTDMDEDGRILDGDNSGGARVDIGADEYIDTDSDGVQNSEEMGPDGYDSSYDGNDDMIPDSQQNSVTSTHTYDDTGYVTLASSPGTALSEVQSIAPPAPSPDGVELEYGCFGFIINGVGIGGSAIVTLFGPEGATYDTFYKYGSTIGNPSDHWYEFLYDAPSQTGAQINGNEITLYFVDGQRGDDDLSLNGEIVEPGGPAIVSVPECEGDFDIDSDVDGSDFVVFIADFDRANCDVGDPCKGDFDNDNDVDDEDLATFAAAFGRVDCF